MRLANHMAKVSTQELVVTFMKVNLEMVENMEEVFQDILLETCTMVISMMMNSTEKASIYTQMVMYTRVISCEIVFTVRA